MDGTRFRCVSESETNDPVSATFLLSHFRSFLFPLRSGDVFFQTHVQDRMIYVSEILPLRTIKVNKGKFTLDIGPLNGSHALNTSARCIDATTVKCGSSRFRPLKGSHGCQEKCIKKKLFFSNSKPK